MNKLNIYILFVDKLLMLRKKLTKPSLRSSETFAPNNSTGSCVIRIVKYQSNDSVCLRYIFVYFYLCSARDIRKATFIYGVYCRNQGRRKHGGSCPLAPTLRGQRGKHCALVKMALFSCEWNEYIKCQVLG